MSAIVKICGLREAEHVDAAVEAGAGLTGFVFFEPSPRNIAITDAAALTSRVPDGVRKVALSVDADDDLLRTVIDGTGVDTLQLHGSETIERVSYIRETFGLPVIKALPISTADDVAAAHEYEGHADMLLFDAKPPKDATRPGGNAEAFDWTLLQTAGFRVPWLLAGGLDAGNVADAIRISGAPMVDVSSGVEDAPGQKNTRKIREFIAAVDAA
ncbi:MAG: phosphoribosylanthranilate isomerase [Rhodospirillales bacterium]|nr:phosphoribosylanthranilate isomerase [Rhodospirillales bacterium]MBO6787882.1 phosphoribosylanthranilate isomerase [Rhodospirillales bacterium]